MEKKKGDMDANMDGESRSVKRVVGSTLGRRLCFMLRKYNIREETSKFTNEARVVERESERGLRG